MKIIFIHSHMFHFRTWNRVAKRLQSDGIVLNFFQQQAASEAVALLDSGDVDLVIGELSRSLPAYSDLIAAAEKATHRVGIGLEMPLDFCPFAFFVKACRTAL